MTVMVGGVSAMYVNERLTQRDARLGGDAAGTLEDCGKVDVHSRNADSEFPGPPRQLGHTRRRDRGLRRRAAEVHARASGILPLGDRYAPGLLRERVGERNARLSGSEDEEVDRDLALRAREGAHASRLRRAP